MTTVIELPVKAVEALELNAHSLECAARIIWESIKGLDFDDDNDELMHGLDIVNDLRAIADLSMAMSRMQTKEVMYD